MLKRVYLSALLLVTVLQLQALTVTSTAGKLATKVSDMSITTLTVNGTLDARDFLFITDNLSSLKTLNLESATIVAYNSTLNDRLLAGEYHYAENTMPYCALVGMTTLQEVTLPANLTAIDYGAFAGCKGLKAITFPTTLTTIGDDAFNSCAALTQVTIINSISHLGNSAFAHCAKLVSAVVNPTVTIEMGNEVFADCPILHNVRIGPKVTALGNGTFNGCKALKKINIMPGSKLEDIGEMTFYNTGLEVLDLEYTPHLKHLGAWALARTRLKAFSLPAHVKSLDEGILFYSSSLSSLELPKTLSYLPDYMLSGCDNISGSPFMTQNMSYIGDFAIYNQSQHRSLKVPLKVHYIGSHAMAGTSRIEEITSEPLQVPELGDNVWAGINQGAVRLNVKEESLNDYRAAMQWQNFLIEVGKMRGDVNSDGYVNTLDAICLRKYLVEGISQGINLNNTDVAYNARTDVADIVAIYNIINAADYAQYPVQYWFDDIIETIGTETAALKVKLDIYLNNTNNYTAFQFDINTPSHITIDGAQISSRGIGHEIYVGKTGDNSYRLVCYSPAGDDIEGNSGLLVTLSISSTKNLTSNDDITLRRIYFADYLENIYYNNNISLHLKGETAIDTITASNSDNPVDVYNTQGQLLRHNVSPAQATIGLPAGIYIVGGKKVVVK